MNAVRLGTLLMIALTVATGATAPQTAPPIAALAADEVLKQFDAELRTIEQAGDAEIVKVREKAVIELKKMQDIFCKEAKLDEAVAIRDVIRSLRAGKNGSPTADFPAAAREVYGQYEREAAEVRQKYDAEVRRTRVRIAAELKKLQDVYCKEGKLDEAVAVRDLLRDGTAQKLANPGYVSNPAEDIGKVFHYDVVGSVSGGSIYGTEVFTTGSYLAMAAVHSGVLKNGQRGVVRVTILPGQANYASTTQHGVTSAGYSSWGVSFKVERAFGFVREAGE